MNRAIRKQLLDPFGDPMLVAMGPGIMLLWVYGVLLQAILIGFIWIDDIFPGNLWRRIFT